MLLLFLRGRVPRQIRHNEAETHVRRRYGRVVRTFNLGNRAAGAYNETLDAGAIARGRYIGVLQVNGRVAGKALLLKR